MVTTEGLLGNEAKIFHEALPKTKLPSFKNTAKSVIVQNNNKQYIAEVNIDILSWLANLSGHFRRVNNLLIDCLNMPSKTLFDFNEIKVIPPPPPPPPPRLLLLLLLLILLLLLLLLLLPLALLLVDYL